MRGTTKTRWQAGLTLVEAVLAVGLFVGIAVGLFTTFVRVSAVMRLSQAHVIGVALANEQFEIARNLPYAKVGIVAGIPSGLLSPVQTLVRGGMTFIATTTVRNIDQPFDGLAGGAPNDLSPADNKLVEVEITCITCANPRPVILSTILGPKDLESASTNGSLFVRAFDAMGQPVSGVDVHISNDTLVPVVNINDVTNASGMLQLIDAPPSVSAYQISVSKSGYSIEQTHGAPTTTNPVKPHATVAIQTVTQLTFFIDLLATLNVFSVSPTCAVIPNVGVSLLGAKLLATTPDVPKYDKWFSTGALGSLTRTDIEWDTYTILASSTTYDLAGVSTLSPFSVSPGATQSAQVIMVPKSAPAVLITVRDLGTGLPLSGASVTMDLAGASTTDTTGRGFLKQTDWSGGAGQIEFTDIARYRLDDTNVDTTSVSGDMRLKDVLGSFPSSGTLESSIFDTGSVSNFYQFTYLPLSQPPAVGSAPILFQLSSGVSTTSMGAYVGPDGTAATFYSSTSTDISPTHNGDRYIRYQAVLTTASSTLSPTLSDALFTFTSACVPPGQVLFQGLASGTYDITVSKVGYTDYIGTVTVNAGTPWQEVQVPLAP